MNLGDNILAGYQFIARIIILVMYKDELTYMLMDSFKEQRVFTFIYFSQ